jgi:hypothetical protein
MVVSIVTQNNSNRAQEKRDWKVYFKTKHQKVILQLNAAINKYVLHILTITIFVSWKQIAIIGGGAAASY